MINGKQIRINKLLSQKHSVFLALDHGFSMGPISGIENINNAVSKLCGADIDSVILNYGALKNLTVESFACCQAPVIVHLTGSEITRGGADKNTLYSPMSAIKMGADAVSVQINFGTDSELEQIRQVADVISQADDIGLPVLLMAYDRSAANDYAENLKKIVRLGIEIGADILKVDVRNNTALLEQICATSSVPIMVAGGGLEDSAEFLERVKLYLEAGAAGISVGRNIFQGDRPLECLREVCRIAHEKAT